MSGVLRQRRVATRHTHVDYQTQQRTPKDSAKWFSEMIRTRQIPSTDPATWG